MEHVKKSKRSKLFCVHAHVRVHVHVHVHVRRTPLLCPSPVVVFVVCSFAVVVVIALVVGVGVVIVILAVASGIFTASKFVVLPMENVVPRQMSSLFLVVQKRHVRTSDV